MGTDQPHRHGATRGIAAGAPVVVVDDTFSRRFLRDRCRAMAARCGARFAILYIDTTLDVIVARRAENERTRTRHRVRDDVFAAHRDGSRHPQADEGAVRIASDEALSAWLAAEIPAARVSTPP